MKVKTLLLAVALSAAGIASSMAQVYSVNVVGYVNLTLQPGFSLVANQLNTGNNQLNTVLPNVPGDTQVQKFNPATLNYDTYFFDSSLPGWIDFDGNPATATIAPGDGFFVFNPNPGPATVTLVGEVQTGQSTVVIPPGFRLFSSVIPQVIELSAANGFSLAPDMEFHTYVGAPTFYKKLIYDPSVPSWLNYDSGAPETASLNIGQGAFIFNPGPGNRNWVRNFVIP